jgi:putative ATPase
LAFKISYPLLVGTTTENPSFEVNSALLSRSRVFTFRGLGEEAILTLLRRARATAVAGMQAVHFREYRERVRRWI